MNLPTMKPRNMILRTSSVLIVAFLVLSSTWLSADQRNAKDQISATRLTAEFDQHTANVRSLDRRFREGLSSLEKSYIEERRSLREALVKSLTKQKKTLTKKGELDQAVAIRDYITRLEATEIVPPSLSDPRGILGTWRWNNGVDIRNLVDGQTSGNGTWRLVDPGQQTYEFQWKRIPADRVTLSPNGRVLEGTKASDPSFRVWAVRID